MKIEKGWNRFVIVAPKFGIAIKLPIIHLFLSIKILVKLSLIFEFRSIFLEMALPISDRWSYKNRLFGGIVTNWREFIFYRRTKNPFLQPTYFSFLGLINIQKMGTPCDISYVDLWCQLLNLTDSGVMADNHHFENSDNFCFDSGKLKIHDYGSIVTQKVITEYGTKIYESFDPGFNLGEFRKTLNASKK